MMDDNVTNFAKHAMLGFKVYVGQQLKIQPNSGYRFIKVKDSPRVMCIYILTNPVYFKPLSLMEPELSMAMGLTADLTARIRRFEGRVIRVEVPKPKDLCFSIQDKDLPHREHKAAIGSDLDGRSIFVDLEQPLQAHILIAGMTGSGKTILQKNMAIALSLANDIDRFRLCVIDVSKRGMRWKDLNKKAHLLHPVVVDEVEALKMAAWFVKELDMRAGKNFVPPAAPRYALVIDEFADLVEGSIGPAIVPHLVKLTQMGREYGMHCIISTQHPTVSALGSSLAKRQFGVRFVGKMDDGLAAKTAAGIEDCGAQYLSGAGDFVSVKEDRVTRFQVAIPTSGSINQMPDDGDHQIDLSGIEDPEMILRNCRVGRPEEPLDYTVVGQFVAKLAEKGMPASFHTAGSWIIPRIAPGKAERHIKLAKIVLDEVKNRGYEVIKIRPGESV